LQIKIKVLEAQAALNPLFNGTALQPSSAGVDDEDDEMDMEEGGGGSSSGTASQLDYTFSSNRDTFVKRKGAVDTEARCFPVGQEDALAQYMQSLSRPPAASSSGAAGGSVLSGFHIEYSTIVLPYVSQTVRHPLPHPPAPRNSTMVQSTTVL
jgi:hypothetical protein